MSLEEFERSTGDLVKQVTQQTVLIQRNGETVAVLTSPQEYETTREARAQRALDSLHAFQAHMASSATPEELEELVKELDTNNS